MQTNVDFYSIDNKIYLVIKEITLGNNNYLLLSNEMNNSDIMVRKQIGETLEPLDDVNELVSVIPLFLN